mmetsp:Transcript_10482/g.28862  ORF Transcript_10482/g.28862 Transcript_10482/m.28862 type:complete len:87 (-) Transcript_10482:482-742(-)
MNIDHPQSSLQNLIATTTSETHNGGPTKAENCILPTLIQNHMPLTTVPTKTLRTSLEPIVQALKNLDAEVLLDLQQAEAGARVAKG